MTPEGHQLIRDSWTMLHPIGSRVATTFYKRLFVASPSAASLFGATNMPAQRRKFAAMLSEIVRVIDQPDILAGEAAESGRRHAGYHVESRHYEDVGGALLWTFEHELGDKFTPEMRAAWREAYALLAAVMQRAAAHG